MLLEMFEAPLLTTFSRPNSPNETFVTFTDSGNAIFGSGSQNVTNCGSSMLIDTPNTYPIIKEMFTEHFNLDSVPVQYMRKNRKFDYDGENYCGNKLSMRVQNKTAIDTLLAEQHGDISEEAIYRDIRAIFNEYKNNKKMRNELNEVIFLDIDTLTLNNNLSIAYTFIVYAIITIKNNHCLNKPKDPCYKSLKTTYPTEKELFSKIAQVLKTADELDDLTDCCAGRYRFVDYHLSKLEDIKLLPKVLVYSFIDEKDLIGDIISLKRG